MGAIFHLNHPHKWNNFHKKRLIKYVAVLISLLYCFNKFLMKVKHIGTIELYKAEDIKTKFSIVQQTYIIKWAIEMHCIENKE